MQRRTMMALALGLTSGFCAADGLAQRENDEPVTQLGEVTVTSTRTQRSVDDVPNTVSVITRSQIEQSAARDIKDLLVEELDVSVRQAPTRFTAAGASVGRAGVEGINIRGLEENQVLMMIDGIRIPANFSTGPFASGRGDFIDADGLKSVEILRGPTSIQFGSDGLGGALSLRTIDPVDVLESRQRLGESRQHVGETRQRIKETRSRIEETRSRVGGAYLRTGYASVDDSWVGTAAVAGRSERWQGLLLGSYRAGHEVKNKGTDNVHNVDRTTANPVDYHSAYWLGKGIFTLDTNHQFGLTAEMQERKRNTEVYSARAKPPLAAASVLDLDANDKLNRNRLSLDHRYHQLEGAWIQKAESKVYWQKAKVNQHSAEDRNTSADRTRDTTYETEVVGLSTLLESNFSQWVNQRVSYGFDWSQAQITGVRDGTVPPPGETFPVKPFPDTKYTLAGLFVQSEMEFGGAQGISVIPALRFDHYKLDPSTSGYTSSAVAALSGQAITPRLGVIWRLLPAFAPYAQWARGFNAPAPEQVNNGFVNVASGYVSIANPNLKAEKAESFEIGLRGKLATWRYSTALFHSRYKDFIRQQNIGGSGTPTDPTVFQYINLADAQIRGFEMRSEWAITNQWSTTAGLAYAKGDSQVNGDRLPLDTINPLKIVVGVRHDRGHWGVRGHLIHSRGKEADRVNTVTTAAPNVKVAQFTPPSYTVVDLGFYWKPLRNFTANASLNNIFDSKYWRWSDVRGLAADSGVQDAYSAPGRNATLSVRYDF